MGSFWFTLLVGPRENPLTDVVAASITVMAVMNKDWMNCILCFFAACRACCVVVLQNNVAGSFVILSHDGHHFYVHASVLCTWEHDGGGSERYLDVSKFDGSVTPQDDLVASKGVVKYSRTRYYIRYK